MRIEIIQLKINSYLVLATTDSAVVTANTVDDLAKELNLIAKKCGVPQDCYRAALDRQPDSPTYGKQVLLLLLPTGHYSRVLVSN